MTRINWKILLVGSLLVFPLLAVLALSFGNDPHSVPFLLQKKQAPVFKVKRVQSNPEDKEEWLTLADYRGKTPLVVNFWSTWCTPCRAEHPVLEWGYQMVGDKIPFLGMVYEDTEENIRKHLQSYPSNIPQALDTSGRMAVDYGLSGVPETYFIDKMGIIRYKHVGPIDQETLLVQLSALVSF